LKTIYLSEHIHPAAMEKLRRHARIVNSFDEIENVDGIIVRGIPLDRDLMTRAKKLKVICKHGVGFNKIDVAAARELGIVPIYTPTANTNSVAELIVGFFIILSRRIYEAYVACRNGEIKEIAPAALEGTEITGKTLGLIGVGNISRRVAEIMRKGFDVDAICYDPYVSPEEAARHGITKFEALAEVVSRADLVNVSVPLTPSTVNLISGDVFSHFKPSAFLVNASRGSIVNENDLYRALTQGGLAGAACDVFEVEPPTGQNPLLSLRNFVATPHIGACSKESLLRVGMECVEQVLSIIDGGKPLHPIP